MKQRKTGEIGFYTGKTRSGKTYQLQRRITRHRRAIVWSVKEQVDRYGDTWADSLRVSTLADLKALVMEYGAAPGHIIYTPRRLSDFADFCRCAHAWGIIAPCSVVAEELADVTTPGKAPDGWGNLLRQGCGWGINVYAVSQRPAESDKTVIGNMSFIHAHQIMRARDRVYIAEEMNLPLSEIEALTGYQWIERWATGEIKRGR